MHDPKPKFYLCLALLLVGAAIALFGWFEQERIGAVPGALVPLFGGGLLALFGLSFALHYGQAARREAKMRSGADAVARWWVSAADWARFRAFDDAREPYGANALRFRSTTRPDGIEVIFGRTALMVDGSVHQFKGMLGSRTPCSICWFQVSPSCLELSWTVEDSDSTGIEIVRLPAPEAARSQAQKAFDYYSSQLPEGSREWAERQFKRYDFGAYLPKGFEAGSPVAIPEVFANRRNRKRRDAAYLVAIFTGIPGLYLWFMRDDGLMPSQLATDLATVAIVIAGLAGGLAAIFAAAARKG